MFDEFLQHEINRLALPGVAVAILDGQHEVYADGFGFTDAENSKPVTADTVFGVASVTKLLTAVEVLRLAEQGKLNLDDAVESHIPGLQVARHSSMQLVHLLSHSAGFPGLDSRFKAAEFGDICHNSRNIRNACELIDYLNSSDMQLQTIPGEFFNYSNESFCLLGGIIEQLRSTSFADTINGSILAKLQLDNSMIGCARLSSHKNIAYPLVSANEKLVQQAFWDAPLFYPAGGLLTSARDSASLLSHLFGSSQLLSKESQNKLLSNVIAVPSRPVVGVGYGLGLEYRQLDADNTIVWHTGQRPGISSFVAWHVQQEIAVSVLSHVSEAPVAGIGFELLGKLFCQECFIWPPLVSDRELVPTMNFDGQYTSTEGFDFEVVTDRAHRKLIANHHANAKCEHPEPIFKFHDATSGTVGTQTFRIFMDGYPGRNSTIPVPVLALDLRTFSRNK